MPQKQMFAEQQVLNQRAFDATVQGAATLPARYQAMRQATRDLCVGLSAEDCALQSIPDASPVKWHLAHTSWFFETFILQKSALDYRQFDPAYKVLFNSYYVGVGERHPRSERGMLSRPVMEQIISYREHVDHAMQRLLERRLPEDVVDLIELGIQHEQQHQELILTDLKHLFSRNPLKPAYRSSGASEKNKKPENRDIAPFRWLPYPAGLHLIGHDGHGFAFDNELPRHRVYLESRALAHRLVTNAEYLAFINDGGYARPELWLSEGWDTLRAQQWEAPSYWQKIAGQWRNFTLHGLQEIEPAAPVCHVSYFEADAYARWVGARLPTEMEWEVAAQQLAIEGNFVEGCKFKPLPARDSNTGSGLLQMFGDVWEWTQSAYSPYPGYQAAPGAVGEYNGKFMVNQYVLRGGSFATPRSHVRASYRNFFPAGTRWQFSGIRLARDAR